MATLDVFYRDDTVLYGDLQGIWLMLLFGPPDATKMKRAGPTLTEMAKRYPAGFANITLVTQEAGLTMDTASREAAAELTAQFEREMKADCTVIDGDGFWPATVRAIVGAVHLLSRVRHPRAAFRTLPEAIDWSIQHMPVATRQRFDKRAAVAAAEDALASVRAR
jgi:hypothetical protein